MDLLEEENVGHWPESDETWCLDIATWEMMMVICDQEGIVPGVATNVFRYGVMTV